MELPCHDKIPFATKEAATGAAALARHRYGPRLFKPYKCQHCGDWHLASADEDDNEDKKI